MFTLTNIGFIIFYKFYFISILILNFFISSKVDMQTKDLICYGAPHATSGRHFVIRYEPVLSVGRSSRQLIKKAGLRDYWLLIEGATE